MTIPRFEIQRTPEISALMKKYDGYGENYILGEQEQQTFAVLPSLSEWERVVLFAYSENKSVRKFAKFFGISEWTARKSIEEVRARVKRLYKKL